MDKGKNTLQKNVQIFGKKSHKILITTLKSTETADLAEFCCPVSEDNINKGNRNNQCIIHGKESHEKVRYDVDKW